MKILIAYFSRAGKNYFGGSLKDLPVGNTEVAAMTIRNLVGGDAFKIESVKPYPLDYDEATKAAQREQRQNARPELVGRVEGMDGYEVVFLGYPNWWGTMPMPVFTFLEAYDFSGKTIAPFCTHEGSGLGRSETDIKRLCPASEVLKGLPIRGANVRDVEGEISNWVKRSGAMSLAQR